MHPFLAHVHTLYNHRYVFHAEHEEIGPTASSNSSDTLKPKFLKVYLLCVAGYHFAAAMIYNCFKVN